MNQPHARKNRKPCNPLMEGWRDAIYKAMRDLGFNQREIAARAGISEGALSHVLAGQTNPPLSKMQRISAAVGLELSLTITHADTPLRIAGKREEAGS